MHLKVEDLGGVAQRVERDGWTGMVLTDTQNRSPEAYVSLAVAALATERIGLAVGVTNPVTRHPALAAAAAATVQRLSHGRMSVMIGRGDSAAAHIGGAPVRLPAFEQYVSMMSRYLNRDVVSFDEVRTLAMSAMPSISTLRLAGEPLGSSLEWLRPDDRRVPLDVAGSGPKVLEIAARHSDCPMIAVGASSERVAWAVGVIRDERLRIGVDPMAPIGAFVNAVTHDDPAVANRMIKGVLASTSRFSVMQGSVTGPADESTRGVLQEVRRRYDMTGHGTAGSQHSAVLTDSFVAAHGIAGKPGYVRDRLTELSHLGISKFVTFPTGRAADPDEVGRARVLMAREVVAPLIQAAAGD
jgi:5,10-methylenetetrahydromethanopterin reductase